LRNYIFGTTINKRRGKLGVLTDEEEAQLEDYLFQRETLGFPLTIGQLREKIEFLLNQSK